MYSNSEHMRIQGKENLNVENGINILQPPHLGYPICRQTTPASRDLNPSLQTVFQAPFK